MRSLIFAFLSIALLAVSPAYAQTTATDFTQTDCKGNSCKLFDVLDSGHVVVICWVMPCGSCTGGATKSFNAAKAAQSGSQKVYYFLIDDYGNTDCNALSSWGASNGVDMSTAFVRAFANTGNAIDMKDYGTAGMPKAAILAGPSHKVYYNVNGSTAINATAMTDSINQAIADINANSTKESGDKNSIDIFPNPAENVISIASSAPLAYCVKLYSANGEILYSGNFYGSTTIPISDYSSGVYYLEITGNDTRRLEKIIKNQHFSARHDSPRRTNKDTSPTITWLVPSFCKQAP